MIYTGEDLEYTITYDANGGTGAPKPQTAYHGMSIYLSSERPTYEGKMFVGWSTDKNGSEAMYYQNGYMPASMFTSSETDITLYAIWTEDEKDLPLLADRVKVGDYVNYPVYYENVPTVNGEQKATLNGWRVLSIENDGTVNLVSAGVPLTYYNGNNDDKNLVINFLDIPTNINGSNVYRKNGFHLYDNLKEAFNNKYTATFNEGDVYEVITVNENGIIRKFSGEKSLGDLKVRSMTKVDADKIYDPTGNYVIPYEKNVLGDSAFQKMLSIPAEKGKVHYWLASYSYQNDHLTYFNGSAYTIYYLNNSYYGECGIRPVVSLKPTVKTTGTDMAGRWSLEIAE